MLECLVESFKIRLLRLSDSQPYPYLLMYLESADAEIQVQRFHNFRRADSAIMYLADKITNEEGCQYSMISG